MKIAWLRIFCVTPCASGALLLMLVSATVLPVTAQTAREIGQRQNREQAALGITPLARIDSRIQNRITSRIGGRVDRSGMPQTGQAQRFDNTLGRSRAVPRRP